MQNKQNTNYISFQKKEHIRISQWKQIRIAYRLNRITYRLGRFKKQYPNQNIERNLERLNKNFMNLNLPPMNPYHYWGNRQFTLNTSGMKFHAKWY